MRRRVPARGLARRGAGGAMAVAMGVAVLACTAAPPRDHTGREVRIAVGDRAAPVLAGVLETPRAADETASPRRPAILILGGSGPQDRDGARPDMPGYRPWRELADTLLARGFAVLRLDDRGTGLSTGQFAGSTTEDFAADARAALAWLRRQSEIDPTRVALVGHSEGGLVALLVARADTAVRALALLGAPARSGREIARWQRQSLVGSDLAAYPPAERPALLAEAEAAADRLAAEDPWLRVWFALDPRTVASAVRQPVLVLHGETDGQVPVAQARELAAVLRAAGAPVRLETLARTDHLFLPDDDGDPSGYVRLVDRRMRPAAPHAVATFVAAALGVR